MLSFEIFVMGLILSADSFSAAVAMGAKPFRRSDALKFALCSGGAETIAALIGFLAGAHIISLMSSIDHWIGFGLLAAVSAHMFVEGIHELRHPTPPDKEAKEFHSFGKVLVVSLATSLDAFGVGVSLGIADKPITPYLVSIGTWAFVATIVGLYLARSLSSKFGPIFSLIGASVLAFIALQMLNL